jgi:hypothetical protein
MLGSWKSPFDIATNYLLVGLVSVPGEGNSFLCAQQPSDRVGNLPASYPVGGRAGAWN